jgi:hypothetical protein
LQGQVGAWAARIRWERDPATHIFLEPIRIGDVVGVYVCFDGIAKPQAEVRKDGHVALPGR